MTGRVCEKHGEYAPDGICRWCEPEDPRKVTAEELAEMFVTSLKELAQVNADVVGESPGTSALRDAKALIYMDLTWKRGEPP